MNTQNGLFLALVVLVLALVAVVGTTNQTQAATDAGDVPVVLDYSDGGTSISTDATSTTVAAAVSGDAVMHIALEIEGTAAVTMTPQCSNVETGTYVDLYRSYANDSGVPVDTDFAQSLTADGAVYWDVPYCGSHVRASVEANVDGSGVVTPVVTIVEKP
jgi:hypothetical protein